MKETFCEDRLNTCDISYTVYRYRNTSKIPNFILTNYDHFFNYSNVTYSNVLCSVTTTTTTTTKKTWSWATVFFKLKRIDWVPNIVYFLIKQIKKHLFLLLLKSTCHLLTQSIRSTILISIGIHVPSLNTVRLGSYIALTNLLFWEWDTVILGKNKQNQYNFTSYINWYP